MVAAQKGTTEYWCTVTLKIIALLDLFQVSFTAIRVNLLLHVGEDADQLIMQGGDIVIMSLAGKYVVKSVQGWHEGSLSSMRKCGPILFTETSRRAMFSSTKISPQKSQILVWQSSSQLRLHMLAHVLLELCELVDSMLFYISTRLIFAERDRL